MVRQIFHLRISPVVIGFPVDTLINRGGSAKSVSKAESNPGDALFFL